MSRSVFNLSSFPCLDILDHSTLPMVSRKENISCQKIYIYKEADRKRVELLKNKVIIKIDIIKVV